LKTTPPCSFTASAPRCRLGCHTAIGAPSGSANIAIRPASNTSNGSLMMVAPAASALAAVSSALSTHTYVFHTATGGRPRGSSRVPAAARPPIVAMKYCPDSPSGIMSSHVQPNRPL
jgi:hypothetical protein